MDLCGDCKYFVKSAPHEQPKTYIIGTCRASPPSFFNLYDNTVAKFPVVREEQRACGGFKVAHLDKIEV